MQNKKRMVLLLCCLVSVLVGCSSPVTPTTTANPSGQTVKVYFVNSADQNLQAVERQVPPASNLAVRLQTVLQAQLAGPTPQEQAAGLSSVFSEQTADMLNDVTLDGGAVTVDFKNFAAAAPNASTSAGSAALLGQLNSTIFQFDEIESVTYQFDGDCDAFWAWLQSTCQAVTRDSWATR